MISPNPRSSGDHGYDGHHDTDDTPGEDDLRRVLLDVMLERTDYSEDEPGNAGSSTSRVNATDVLEKTGPEYTHPQRGPLVTTIISKDKR